MKRRELLWALLALAATPVQAGVRKLPAGCSPSAYTELMQRIAQANRGPAPEYDERFLNHVRPNMVGSWEAPGAVWLPLGPFRLRVMRPAQAPVGVILNLHGGGWVSGSALSDEPANHSLLQKTGWAVVSVDYRLAPEHPYPAPVQDCEAAARWLLENGEREFGTRRFVIQGRSAGAHLAALTLQRLGAQARAFAGAVLYYGIYDLSGTLRLRMAEDDEYPDLRPSAVWQFIEWFTPGWAPQARASADLSPLQGSLEHMPPALFLVGGADVLLDDTLLMAQNWGRVQDAQLVEYPGAPHGFDGYPAPGVTDPQTLVAQFLANR